MTSSRLFFNVLFTRVDDFSETEMKMNSHHFYNKNKITEMQVEQDANNEEQLDTNVI